MKGGRKRRTSLTASVVEYINNTIERQTTTAPPKQRKRPRISRDRVSPNVIDSFLNEGWEVATSSGLKRVTPRLQFGEKDMGPKGCCRTWKKGSIQSFPRVMPMKALNLILEELNNNLVKTLSEGVGVDQRRRYKKVKMEEFLGFYGLYILLEQVYGPNCHNLKKARKKVLETYFNGETPSLWVGIHRYEVIFNHMFLCDESFRKLETILEESWLTLWVPGQEFSWDEAIWAYKPSAGVKSYFKNIRDPIQVTYIPRKTHPNGFKAWLLVSKNESGQPFVLKYHQCLKNNYSGTLPLLKLLEEWSYHLSPHIVVDSALGSFDLMDQIAEKNAYATMSISSKSSKWLWNLLLRHTPTLHWNMSTNSKGYTASVTATWDDQEKISYQRLLTNYYIPSNVTNFKNISEGEVELESPFSEVYLKSLKLPQVKNLAKENGLSPGKRNKPDLISYIIDKTTLRGDEANKKTRVQREIETHKFKEENNSLHRIYRALFNGTDKVSLINGTTLTTDTSKEEIETYRITLGKTLLSSTYDRLWQCN